MSIWKKISTLAAALLLAGSATAFAFDDTKGDPAEQDIEKLVQAGVINGINDWEYDPHGIMTMAQGVQLIVRDLDLNIRSLRFIKEPLASDSFDHPKHGLVCLGIYYRFS